MWLLRKAYVGFTMAREAKFKWFASQSILHETAIYSMLISALSRALGAAGHLETQCSSCTLCRYVHADAFIRCTSLMSSLPGRRRGNG